MDKINLKCLVDRRLTIKKMAQELGCSQTNVRYWLRKHGLKAARGPGGKHLDSELKECRRCSHCGETDPKKFYGHKRHICGRCQNRYNTEKGRQKRKYMREKLGGKCSHCGFASFQSALEVHHLDPSKKDVSFRAARGWSYARIDRELIGCVLLCSNCHQAVHSGELYLSMD